MSTGTIASAFAEKSSGPYGKALKCKVVAIDEPYEYKAKTGQTMKAQVAAVSDGSSVSKIMCYDCAKFKFLKVGQTVVLHNVIRRVDDGVKALVITSASKAFMATPLNIPEEHNNLGRLLVFPPPAEVVPLKLALDSPVKRRVSITAKIVQEDESKTVEVKGDPVTIKTVTVEDESGQGKVTLWRACAAADVRPGDFVTITDVVSNQFNNQTTLSTTIKSKVHKCEAPQIEKNITVEGINVDGEKAELFLADSTCLTVSAELLQTALSSEAEPVPDVEMATSTGPLNLNISIRGSETLCIKKM